MLTTDDLLTELDVLAVDSTVLTGFAPDTATASANLAAKRRIVIEDWLRGRLEQAGLVPGRHLVRRSPDLVYGYTAGAYTDLTEQASDYTAGGLDLSTVITSPTQDALFLRSSQPFRALWCSLFDHVNTVASTKLTASYWNGGKWAAFNSVVDGTGVIAKIAFSGGGRIAWQTPTDWQKRALGADEAWGYWVRLQISHTPTAGTTAVQMLPVRTSRLTAACVYRVLAMLYGESWGIQRGEWREKAQAYDEMASEALQFALPQLGDEFVAAAGEEAITAATAAQMTGPDPSLFSFERG